MSGVELSLSWVAQSTFIAASVPFASIWPSQWGSGGKGMVRCVDSSKVSCARVKLTLIHSPRLHPRQLCLHSVLYGHLDQFCVSFPTFYTETYIHIITYHHHHQPWISSDPPSLHHIFFKALNLHIMKSLKMMVSMITVMRIYGLAWGPGSRFWPVNYLWVWRLSIHTVAASVDVKDVE